MSSLVRARTRLFRSMLPTILVTAGIVASSLIMWRSSDAAFTATTSNGSDSFSTGSVVIADNDSGTALFNLTNMKPGATGSACIRVTYSGTLAAAVKLYASAAATTNALSSYITLQIEESTGNGTTTFPSCAGLGAVATLFNSTMASFGSSNATYATGVSSWAPSGAASRDYRITYTLSDTAPNGTMSSTASMTLTWEAQNT